MSKEELAELIELHDGLFMAHLSLWQDMIDTARGRRTFTANDLGEHEAALGKARTVLDQAMSGADPATARRARALHDKRLMDRYGLLFDDQMTADIDMLVGNVMRSRPTLIVGDKGIAKTQLAKFVMSLFGSGSFVISVKGDLMSDELIGQVKHDKEQGTFRFYEGAVPTAMRSGLPVLLDEINFGDQAVIARLQEILLKKPGETAFIQEEGVEIEVKPGFVIMATANEASVRYRHREVLDPAIRDRFEILTRTYPDLDGDPLFGDTPSLSRLAWASEIDEDGGFSEHIQPASLEALVRVAAISQHLYAVPAREATIRFDNGEVSSAVREGAEPLLSDCITPRALVRAIEDSAPGNLPGRSLDAKLITRLVRALDQAGSSINWELMSTAAELAGIDVLR